MNITECQRCEVKMEKIDCYVIKQEGYDCICEDCYFKLLKENPEYDTYPTHATKE